MLLKILRREVGDTGSWAKGLDVEKRFLIDSVKIDSTAFSLEDGSGLAAGNLVTPHAFVQLLAYMYRHPKRAPFLAALPRAQQLGSLLRRFQGTPLEGRVLAKTGSISRVNTLSGRTSRRPMGGVITFSIQVNAHDVRTRQMPGADRLSGGTTGALVILLTEQGHVRRVPRHDLRCGIQKVRDLVHRDTRF
jgi:PBP4 family serine-type D-alanyl-D-alanine carboxypeptidase